MSALWPLVLSWLGGAALLFADGRRRGVGSLAALVLLAVALLDASFLVELVSGRREPFELVTGGWAQGVGIRLRVDRLSCFFGAVCAGVLAAVMLHEVRAGVHARLFPGLGLLLCAGLHGAFFTGDLFNFYVFFELSVVTSFAQAAYGFGRSEIRGTFIYIAVNLFGSVLFLIGVAAIYHATGTLDLAQIAALATGDGRGPELTLPAALLFVSLSLKLGLFPFHGWVPVLYGHARPSVAAAMSGALVNIGAYGLLRLGFSTVEPAREAAATTLTVLGALATVYGALLAVNRRRPAEIAAYTAVVQAGYLVLALGAGGAHGVSALMLLVLAGSLDKCTMFLSLDGAGAPRRGAAMVSAVSVAGLPVTIGFVAKVELFRAALEGPAGGVIVGAVVVSSTLVLAAVVRFWRIVRARPPERPAPAGVAFALALSSIALGFLAEPATRLAAAVASELPRAPTESAGR